MNITTGKISSEYDIDEMFKCTKLIPLAFLNFALVDKLLNIRAQGYDIGDVIRVNLELSPVFYFSKQGEWYYLIVNNY